MEKTKTLADVKFLGFLRRNLYYFPGVILVALKRYWLRRSIGKIISFRISKFLHIRNNIYNNKFNCTNLRNKKERRINDDEITRKKFSEIHKVLCSMCAIKLLLNSDFFQWQNNCSIMIIIKLVFVIYIRVLTY